jgi:hypothetical protein
MLVAPIGRALPRKGTGVMVEKTEICPYCDKRLDQKEYELQFCRRCGTAPFEFSRKAETASAVEPDKGSEE